MADYQLLGGDGYSQSMEDGPLAGYGTSPELVSPLMATSQMGTAPMGSYPQMHPAYTQQQPQQQQGDVAQKLHYGAYGPHVTPEYGTRVHPMGDATPQASMGYAQQALVGQRTTDQYPYGAMGAPQRAQEMWRGHYTGSSYQHGDGMAAAQHTMGIAGQHHRAVQGQYAPSQEYSLHAPQQHGSPQRPAYGTQGNGPHVAQMTGKAAVATHIPDQSLASYPQTTYPSAQAGSSRATYGTAGTMGHGAVSQSMPSRGIQRPGVYPTATQPPIPQGSPARLQQYPQQSAYSPGHPFPGSDATSPSHLSPYPTQAPNSPQYRGSYPSPRRPTPPAGSPSVVTSQQSSSQGSYPSPGASHLSSPGQVLSPGGTSAATPTSSLQQLEQMVMPHMAAAKAPATSSTSSYYGPTAAVQPYAPPSAQQSLAYATMGGAQHHPYTTPSPSLMARARPLAPDATSFGVGDVGTLAAGVAMTPRTDYPMAAAGISPTAATYQAYPPQQPAASLSYEQAQQQLQHLYSVPQTAQTQKRVR